MLCFEKKNSISYQVLDIDSIAYSCRLSRPIAEILVGRGYIDSESIERFLNPSIQHLHDPQLLKDMGRATTRIKEAIEREEHIVIYGDYDTDGVTASTLLFKVFRDKGVNVDVFLPERRTDGYGLHDGCIERIIKQYEPSLIITVDCGITASEEIEYAKKQGVDVIVTDHHVCPEILPNAVACVNPKRNDQDYPFDGLAGVGVASKLVQSLFGIDAVLQYIDIIALGTIADIVPLIDENRVFVFLGLQKMRSDPSLGIKALIDVAGSSEKTITSTDIGFVLAPRINAGGRMESAMTSFLLLNSDDYNKAYSIALKLNELNILRQTTERLITQEAIDRIEAGEINLVEHRFICLLSDEWDEGVIGIVASRLCEKYTRPVLLFTRQQDSELIKGSGRSIDNIDLFLLLQDCEDLFVQFGGHARAVGVSMMEKDVSSLIDRIENKLRDFDDSLFLPHAEYDLEADINWFNENFMNDLQLLEPFGYGNSVPSFLLRNIVPKQISQIGRGKNHLRMFLQSEKKSIQTIAFGYGDRFDEFTATPSFDLIVTAKYNLWQNKKEIQFLLKSYHATKNALVWRNYLVTRDDVFEELFFSNLYNSSPYDDAVKIKYSDSLHEAKGTLQNSKQGLLLLATTLNSAVTLLRDLETDIEKGLIDVCFREYFPDKRFFNTLLICPSVETVSCINGFETILVFGTPVPGLEYDGIIPDEEMIQIIKQQIRMPSRELIGKIYRLLHSRGISILETDIARKSVIKWGIDVFKELNLLYIDNNMIHFMNSNNKVDLSDSSVYRNAIENHLKWIHYLDYLCEADLDE